MRWFLKFRCKGTTYFCRLLGKYAQQLRGAYDFSNAVFGDAVFGGYFGVDKHGRHLGAQEEVELCLYALVALSEDR